MTAGVHKDPITGEWVLEGGALVLADKGLCLIDEFDKMNDQDRTSIHEAMEQQSISISKAGIVTTLHARCAVIAAANPMDGVYNINKNFNENVMLTDPILSRFDLLTVIKDSADIEIDDSLATFVLNSHMKSHPRIRQIKEHTDEDLEAIEFMEQNLLPESKLHHINPDDQIPQELLRKYIMYAKRYIHPKLSEIDLEKVTQFYADIRRESTVVGGIPIAVRHIESVIRMSEAHAKICLRDYVRSEDIDFAIEMMLNSFLQSQKTSVQRVLQKKFAKYLSRGKSDTNFSVLHHELTKITNRMIVLQKQDKGIEDIDTVTVSLTTNQFRQELGQMFEANTVDDYLKSALFRKEFRIEGNTIKCSRTM